MKKKNLVIIGYGGMGSWHVGHAQKSDCVNLLGIYDIKEERRTLARENGIYAYDSLDAVIADERVELCTVAIPNDAHHDTVIRLLEGGKNVICEKPVALSSAELSEMIAAAKKSGKLFTVHQNRRWDVDFLASRRLREEGKIGKILRVESRIHGANGIPGDWRRRKAHGGGMILDWGVHLIDQMLKILPGKITKVYCECTHIRFSEVDDGFYLTITFDDGAVGTVEVGTCNYIPLPRFYIKGEYGTAIIDDWRNNMRVVRDKLNGPAKDQKPVETAAGLTKTMAPRTEETVTTWEEERPASDVHDFYRNVCRAIDGIEAQYVTHDEVMRVMRVMEAAFASDAAGAPIVFSENPL